MSLEKLEQALDFRDNYEQKVREASEYVNQRIKNKPMFGVTLGSGLGQLANSIKNAEEIQYSEIPNFPTTTVPGHEGKMLIGDLEGVPVIGLKGRKHYYEVADEPFNNGILKTVFPVHVLANLGVENYFVTNAAGGLNQDYGVGDMMIIRSHINLIPNPLMGRHHDFQRVDGKGDTWRFQPMNEAYDSELSEILRKAGEKNSDHLHEGFYLAVTGPSYESEAESIAFMDYADAVGMSTVPEVIVARNRGVRAVGMSCITNIIEEDGTNATNHEEVKAILESDDVKNRLSSTVKNFFRIYADS